MSQYDTIIRTVSDTVYLQCSSNDVAIIKDIVEISNSSISSQISTLNAFIAGFSFIFVIAGIFLGLYIFRLEKRVVKIKDNIEEKESTIKFLAKTIEETDTKIKNDIGGLYTKLREEETLTLLKRLDEEPQDITNLGDMLLARQLPSEGFLLLKSAYKKLLPIGEDICQRVGFSLSKKELYLLMFFQHYMYESLLDNDLSEEMHSFISTGMDCAFKRDIIKTTEDFCKAISINTVSFDKKDYLADYLKALNNSKYKDLIELKNIFENNISSQNLLSNAIEKCAQDNVYLSLFGITDSSYTSE